MQYVMYTANYQVPSIFQVRVPIQDLVIERNFFKQPEMALIQHITVCLAQLPFCSEILLLIIYKYWKKKLMIIYSWVVETEKIVQELIYEQMMNTRVYVLQNNPPPPGGGEGENYFFINGEKN